MFGPHRGPYLICETSQWNIYNKKHRDETKQRAQWLKVEHKKKKQKKKKKKTNKKKKKKTKQKKKQKNNRTRLVFFFLQSKFGCQVREYFEHQNRAILHIRSLWKN